MPKKSNISNMTDIAAAIREVSAEKRHQMVSLDSYIVPTTVRNEAGDLWHPGFKHGLKVFYYEKDIFATEMAAAQCAEDIIAQVTKELNDSLGFGFENGPKDLTA